MHILFDSLSGQVQVHRRLNIRMNTLLGAIRSEGWTYSFSRDPSFPGPDQSKPSRGSITQGQLDGCDVLAILTREPVSFDNATNPNLPPADATEWPYKYLTTEITAITDFVGNGGGLLLISNHGSKPHEPAGLGDTKYDKDLAAAFHLVLNPAHFNDPKNALMSMTTELNHKDFKRSILFQVTTIAVHNSCGIQGEVHFPWTSIAKIPDDAVDSSEHHPKYQSHDPSTGEQQHFAITRTWGSGRVIVAGNSGLAGDDGCTIPAPGTILYGNNLLFLLNCFKYLAGIPFPAKP
jgi:hypothetical protein